MNIKDFDTFMKNITHISMGGKNSSKHLGKGRVLQNCVALVNAYTLSVYGKELCVGNPCTFPVNSQKATAGDIAIWDDYVAIVLNPANCECLSSAYDGYFYRHMLYPEWKRAGHKFRGFYHFPAASSSHDLNAIAKDVVAGKYGNGSTRTKNLKSKLGLTTEEVNEVQNIVNNLMK